MEVKIDIERGGEKKQQVEEKQDDKFQNFIQ